MQSAEQTPPLFIIRILNILINRDNKSTSGVIFVIIKNGHKLLDFVYGIF